jgi:Zn-dependent protease
VAVHLHPRWFAAVPVAAALLGHAILPARYSGWDGSTYWLAGLAAVLMAELTLLLHELSHAAVAHRYAAQEHVITFYGLMADVQSSGALPSCAAEWRIALTGPATNAVVAVFCLGLYQLAVPGSPFGAVALLVGVANLAVGVLNLLPITNCDGARALRAFRQRKGAS